MIPRAGTSGGHWFYPWVLKPKGNEAQASVSGSTLTVDDITKAVGHSSSDELRALITLWGWCQFYFYNSGAAWKMTCSKDKQLSAWWQQCTLLMQFHMYFSAAHLSSPSSGLHHRLSLLTDDFQSRSPGPSLAGQTASCSLTASCDTGISLCRQWLPALQWLPVSTGSGRLLDRGHRSPSGGTPPAPASSSVCSVMKSCPPLCDPMGCGTPGFPVLHYLLYRFQISHYAFSLNYATPLEIPRVHCATSNDRGLSGPSHPWSWTPYSHLQENSLTWKLLLN